VSYVPVTARPLQAEGVVLPAPDNAAIPFTRPVEAWVGSKVGEGIAIGLAKAKQREEEREAADQPPGAIPIPPGAYGCEGEPGGCGEEGEGEGEGGGGARTASRRPGCSLGLRFGEPHGNELLAVAGFWCGTTTSRFQVEVCVYEYIKGKVEAECNEERGKPGQIFDNVKAKSVAYVDKGCHDGINYRAWAWGFVFGNGVPGTAFRPKETGNWRCSGTGSNVDTLATAIEYIVGP
jgi:hypothetical protein